MQSRTLAYAFCLLTLKGKHFVVIFFSPGLWFSPFSSSYAGWISLSFLAHIPQNLGQEGRLKNEPIGFSIFTAAWMRQEFTVPGCSRVPLPAFPAWSVHLIHHSSLVLWASEVAPPLPCALWVTQRLHGLPTALGIREEPGSRESQRPAWHAKGC